MAVFMRLLSLILVVAALMLLGADAVTSLEKGGEITVRSLDQVWALFDKAGPIAFKAWLGHTLPSPVPSWIGAVLALPGWAVTGVPGVILAFLFGRRVSHHN
jgi:hypothetical protein